MSRSPSPSSTTTPSPKKPAGTTTAPDGENNEATGSTGATGATGHTGATGTPAVTGPLSASNFWQYYAKTVCDAIAPCCAAAGHPYDDAKCQASFVTTAMQSLPSSGTYDATAAEDCLDQAEAYTSSCYVTVNTGASPTNACYAVFSGGTKQPGDACSSGSECAQAGSAGSYTFCSSNVCTRIEPGALGDTCVPTAGIMRTCPSTAYCNYASGKCETKQALGQSCTFNSCADALYCPAGAAPKCTTRISIGQSCATQTSGCAQNAWCDSATGKCAARKTLGQTCDTAAANCETSLFCENGTCVSGYPIASAQICNPP